MITIIRVYTFRGHAGGVFAPTPEIDLMESAMASESLYYICDIAPLELYLPPTLEVYCYVFALS